MRTEREERREEEDILQETQFQDAKVEENANVAVSSSESEEEEYTPELRDRIRMQEIREKYCFCEATTTDTVFVSYHTLRCNVCHKIYDPVVIPARHSGWAQCFCTDPIIDEIYLCNKCDGYIPNNDGKMRHETFVSYQRALQYYVETLAQFAAIKE